MSRTTLATRLSAIAAVSAALLIAALAASGAASAGGGNSAAAKLCQKGGWQTLVTSGGTAFASEEACTSYGAAGGAFFPKASAPCLNGGWQAPAQRSDGTAFSSGSDCTTYTSGGGVVYKPTLFALPSHVVEDQNIAISATGFHPNSNGQLEIITMPFNSSSILVAVTKAGGGFSGGSSVFTTGACAAGATGASYTYTDGSGVHASAYVTLDCP